MYKDRTFVFSENITFSVYDRIGAGDAYTTGILHGELSSFSPKKTVQFAAQHLQVCWHVPLSGTPLCQQKQKFCQLCQEK